MIVVLLNGTTITIIQTTTTRNNKCNSHRNIAILQLLISSRRSLTHKLKKIKTQQIYCAALSNDCALSSSFKLIKHSILVAHYLLAHFSLRNSVELQTPQKIQQNSQQQS